MNEEENNLNGQVENNQQPNPPKKSGHVGTIIACIIIVALIAVAITVSILVINKDEDSDSDKKSSKKENTTNSLIEEDEEENENKDKDKKQNQKDDEDEEEEKESKKDKSETVEANGVEYLSDYSAFSFTIDDVKTYLEENMVDKNQKLKENNKQYEIELNQGITCTVSVDKDGYVKELDFSKDISAAGDESAYDSGYQLGYVYGILLGKMGYDDLSKLQTEIVALSTEINDHMTYDEGKSYPQEIYNNYKIVNHSKVMITMNALSDSQIETHYLLLPDKKESGSKY